MIVISKVQNSKLDPNVSNSIKDYIAKAEGKWIQIEIKKAHSKRSDEQNSYYWGVVLKTISDELGGDDKDFATQIHEELKVKFLSHIEDGKLGEEVRITKSTTDLTSMEFTEYIENVKMFVLDKFGIIIPEAKES